MYSITCTVPPADDVVDIVEVKRHLFVADNENNAHIRSLIATAAAACSQYCGRGFGVATWAHTLDTFPGWEWIKLPITPIVADSVAIQYFDVDNASQTIDAADYYVGLQTGTLSPVSVWPATRFRRPEGVTITFQAGSAVVPEQAKHAIKLVVGDWWANRGDSGGNRLMPAAAMSLLDQIKSGYIA